MPRNLSDAEPETHSAASSSALHDLENTSQRLFNRHVRSVRNSQLHDTQYAADQLGIENLLIWEASSPRAAFAKLCEF